MDNGAEDPPIWFDNSGTSVGDLQQIRFPSGEEDNFIVPADLQEGERNGERTPWQRWRHTMLSVGRTEVSLIGKTYAELQVQAGRIQLGSVFESMEEFQFAVDCWSVLNSRINKHLKTTSTCCVRSCIYGFKMRQDPPSRKRKVKVSEVDPEQENRSPILESRSFQEFTQRMPSLTAIQGGTDLNETAGVENESFEVGVRPRRVKRVPTSGACGQSVRHQSAGPFEKNVSVNGSCEIEKEVDNEVRLRCEWRVRCQRGLKTGICKITVCNLQHSCPGDIHMWRGPCQNSLMLAKLMCNRVVVDMNVSAGKLMTDFRQTYENRTSYYAVYRMRERVRDWIQGGQSRSFHAIPALCRRIKEIDPECVVEYDTWPVTGIFKRIFVCPSATRGALQYCQKVIGLNACHTKNKKYPSQIFTSCCSDGNNQSIILCFAVAGSEDEETWRWYCEMMRRSIKFIDHPETVIISDRCKGLLNAVEAVFPDNTHAHCAQHLRMNVKSRYGKDAEREFWKSVYARKETKFNLILDNLKSSGRSGAEASEYIRKIPAELWAPCKFPLPRYGKVASNLAESVNAALKPIRLLAPMHIVGDMWTYIMGTFARRRREADEFCLLTPFCKFRFEENEKCCGQYMCHALNENSALIQKDGGREEYVVRHRSSLQGSVNSCDCLEFQEMQWPCVHSMVWDKEFSRDSMRNIDMIWLTKSLRLIYAQSLPPLVTTDLILGYDCGPPPIAVRKGRHRIVQIPDGGSGSRAAGDTLQYPVSDDEHGHMPQTVPDEATQAQTVSGEATQARSTARTRNKNGPQRLCSICKVLGHNKRTCPQRELLNTTSIDTQTRLRVESIPDDEEGHIEESFYEEDDSGDEGFNPTLLEEEEF